MDLTSKYDSFWNVGLYPQKCRMKLKLCLKFEVMTHNHLSYLVIHIILDRFLVELGKRQKLQ